MIGAVVLAAGLSTRMGSPKMLLKWGSSTVIEQVVDSLNQAGVDEVVVVAGALFEKLRVLLYAQDVLVVVNPKYENGEMTDSLQIGLSVLANSTSAAMIVLGDQPFVNPATVRMLIRAFEKTIHNIVMPSIKNRRGHPWIIRRTLWKEIMALQAPLTMRDFMRTNQEDIHYVLVDDENIIKDMDTPEDYQRLKPKQKS
jgi:molybdenum cofactor cytidylyltransferase